MTFNMWVKRHLFSLWAVMIWLILCVPQNVVMIAKNYYQDFHPDTRNYTCYEFQLDWFPLSSDWEKFKGIIIVIIASFGIVGNLCSILVLQRLATKSGFNRLLLGLGTFSIGFGWRYSLGLYHQCR